MTILYNRFDQTAKRRKLRNSMTKPEHLIWMHLKSRQLGPKFRRQYGIGPYIVDFYCRETRLAVEIDGDSHFTDSGLVHDAIRENYLQNAGIHTIRFTNIDVMRNVSAVIQRIQEYASMSEPPLTPPYEGGEPEPL
jgi:very-short-patch-repair endonuclease